MCVECTCFTSTKAQILTQPAVAGALAAAAHVCVECGGWEHAVELALLPAARKVVERGLRGTEGWGGERKTEGKRNTERETERENKIKKEGGRLGALMRWSHEVVVGVCGASEACDRPLSLPHVYRSLSVKALLRLYYGSIKALLRLY